MFARLAEKIKNLNRLLLILLLVIPYAARAELLPIKTYTSADGLLYEGITRIYQDSRGFLWFGTSVGVSRFDGYQFKNYAMQDGLTEPTISDIIEDNNGVFWLGTYTAGVYRFDPHQKANDGQTVKPNFALFPIDDKPRNNSVIRFFKTKRGEIYLATDGGVFVLNDQNEKKFSRVELNLPETGDQPFYVSGFAEDADGESLWIGHQFGLTRRFPDGRTIHYSVLPDGKSDYIRSLSFDRQNRLWIVTTKTKLAVFNPEPAASIGFSGESKRQLRFMSEAAELNNLKQGFALLLDAKDVLGDGSFNEICQTSDGRIWLTAFGKGLIEFDGREFHLYNKENGLSDNRVGSLLEDGFGNLWLGSTWGAMKMSLKGFVSYKLSDGLAGEDVTDIFQDSSGALYAINTGWKINRFDGKKFASAIPNLPKEAGNWRYHKVLLDSAGDWWIGTRKGLFKFSGVKNLEDLAKSSPSAVFTTQNGFPNDDVYAMFEDSRGDVWLGFWQNTPGKLARWERASNQFHFYSAENGIPASCFPSYFREDAAGNVFIGCRTEFVVVYNREKFSAISAVKTASDQTIHDIFIDHRGRLWIGTAVNGLNRIDQPLSANPEIKNYFIEQGLSSAHIQYLAEDNFGKIYAVTSRGMDRLNPETGEIKYFTLADGLAAAGTGKAVRDKNGVLWLGTARGVSKFVPEPDLKIEPPAVYIGNLRIAGKDFPLSALGETEIGALTLAPDEKQIQIDFYGLNLESGEALRYQYKLEGSGEDWSQPATQRTVNYPNVSPGTYRFLVRAVNSNGAVSEKPAVVSFTILRPIWQRWWFLTLMGILLASAIFALDRYRVKKTRQVEAALAALKRSREERLVELERVRARIATDLHDDIGSSLSQIAVLSEVALSQTSPNQQTREREPLQVISNVSNELVEAMSDIVWAINPRKDNLRDLTQRMRRFAADVLTAKNIEFDFAAPAFENNVQLGANIRREIFVIFKESVNNIARHSGATSAKILFELKENFLKLEISDNGRGFDLDKRIHESLPATRGGNGLPNMQTRARELGGECEIVSAPGKGTTISIKIPLSAEQSKDDDFSLTQTGSENGNGRH